MFNEFPQIETENLILREIKPSDAEAIFQFFSDEQVIRYHDVGAFTSVVQAEILSDRWSERFRNQRGIRWGIAKKDDDIIIGTCGYGQWIKQYFRAEIGYELSKTHWRKGIMTEGLTAVVKFGFEKMELNRIEATVMMENIASMRLLEKLGFQEEGILRKYGFWKGGFHDLKLFSLLKEDCINMGRSR